MSVAAARFNAHLTQCSDAVEIYKFLLGHRYSADFGLRYAWVAAVSALDHYITELIVEKATEHYGNGVGLSNRLLSEAVTFESMVQFHALTPAQAVVEFRRSISAAVRYRTFQKAADIADGLAFVWREQHKWEKIAQGMSVSSKKARSTLNSIAARRDRIVHNADYDEASGSITPCEVNDVEEVVRYVGLLVTTIDGLIS